MQILIALLIFICGFVVGWNGLRLWVTYRAGKIIAQINNRITEIEPKRINVEIKREGDQLYVYNVDTEEFLVQGASKEEIIDALKSKYPNTSFRASSSNMEESGL